MVGHGERARRLVDARSASLGPALGFLSPRRQVGSWRVGERQPSQRGLPASCPRFEVVTKRYSLAGIVLSRILERFLAILWIVLKLPGLLSVRCVPNLWRGGLTCGQ
jgi:hypothetical protein